MNSIRVLDRPASQSFYAVAGRLLFIESFDLTLATLIERLFAGWQLTPVSSPERNPDIKITFTCGELPQVPAGLSEFDVAEGGRCFSAGDEYYLRFENSLLWLRGNKPVDVSVVISEIPPPSDAELARVTSFAVCAALRRFGIFELHCAGVVDPETEAGVLIVGPSGSGKSTLTSQLARAGWGYLSDDEVLLSMNGEEVEARGFRSFFALASTDSHSSLKSRFEPASVFHAPRVARVGPKFLLFTAIGRAHETQLHQLTQAETMLRLIRACPWATYDTAIASSNLKLLSRLARQAKGFNLMAGTDLLEPDRASRIISSVCRS
ncbi:MAG TPA: hypothetical protein VN844_23185 [Pyrinomonadaceae bacterium]|nr:hypothetical protein [Pyrinomonadaceae bacterium]